MYEHGEPTTEVAARVADRIGVQYQLEVRLHFGGTDLTWSQGPYVLDPLEDSLIAVEIPAEAYFSPSQETYVSDLVVRLVAVDQPSGETVERMSAPRLRVVWPDGEQPLLLDSEMADALASNGKFGDDAAPSGEVEGFVYEYGPPR